jgi:uroporphyrinogen decarboxylase
MGERLTSRERVLAAFDHVEADRVPAWLGASPEFTELAVRALGLPGEEGLRAYLGDDFRRVYARYAGPAGSGPLANLRPGATYRTLFGIERHGYGYGQPLDHPLAGATLDQIHAYPWPDPAWMDVSSIRREALRYGGQYAILGGEWSPFWHDAIDLLGMEALILAMYDQPALVDALLAHIVDTYFEISRRTFDAAAGAIDLFFIGNDWGTQCGPVMGEAAFRRFMLPHLKRLIDMGHDYGLKVLLHCCGGFAPLIPALIEAGLDGLQALQPSCTGMDPAQLKRKFGDRIALMGCIDTQHVLIEGTPEGVRRQTRRILEIMKPGGGYIASASHDYLLPETPVENVVAMFETIRECGVYRSQS